ncbi:tellurite resistance TerB family protein [Wenxinia saemankumensis]|uniref:Uncharacterized membrane protein YebE, DUF533 family n=1 Tax=Wenxinia saemankumensis TaxID=1447782 RepID=A0A1M6G306_9RHOB|nr:DUF533 domain-containing protein [Wenxinia saemankumensis]SHJ04309.1 Uncharacterized membrane protein YebE, DUF533 family [Wenxinia saemankumensis]
MSFKRILGAMLASRMAGRGRGHGGLGTAAALALGSRRGGLGRKLGVLGLGYMAYRAYQDHRATQPRTGTGHAAAGTDRAGSAGGLGAMIQGLVDKVAGPDAAEPPEQDLREGEAVAGRLSEDDARLLIRAMVTAAYADGALSTEERARIMQAVEEADGDAQDRAEMERELANPQPVEALLARVQGEEMAEEVYLASCAAIDPRTPRNRAYLDDLRERLGLSRMDAEEIESLA